MDSFHIILRKVRLRHNLTQKQMANTLGVSQASYNRWETRKQNLSTSVFTMLLLLFHDDIEFQKEAAKYHHQLFINSSKRIGLTEEELVEKILPSLLGYLKNNLMEFTTATQKDKE